MNTIKVVKFRGLDIETFEDIYGDLLQTNGKYYICVENNVDINSNDFSKNYREVYDNSVALFTGKTNREGKEIYDYCFN